MNVIAAMSFDSFFVFYRLWQVVEVSTSISINYGGVAATVGNVTCYQPSDYYNYVVAKQYVKGIFFFTFCLAGFCVLRLKFIGSGELWRNNKDLKET